MTQYQPKENEPKFEIDPQDLSRSLIREFLMKSKMDKTLEIFNQEDKRTRIKMTKIDLIRFLSMERLVNNNKQKSHNQQTTMLDILSSYLHSKYIQRKNDCNSEVSIATTNINTGMKTSTEILGESSVMKINGFSQIDSNPNKMKSSSNLQSKADSIQKQQSHSSLQQQQQQTKPFDKNEQDNQSNIKKENNQQFKPQNKASQKEDQNDFTAQKPIQNPVNNSFQQSNKQNIINSNKIEKETVKPKKQDDIQKVEKQQQKQEESNGYGIQQPKKIMKRNNKKNMDDLFKQAEQNDQPQNNVIDDLNDLDNIFESSYQPKQQQKKSPKKDGLKDIWNEEPVKIQEMNKNIEKMELDPNVEYIQLDVLKAGQLGYNFNFPKINLKKTTGLKNLSKRNIVNIDGIEIKKIQKLLFQNAPNKFFPNSWAQGFIFHKEKFFGLLQKEGGPCGIIACVQAYFLKWLLFIATDNKDKSESFFNDNILKENCLIAAIADILWKCSDKKEVKIAVIRSNQSNNVADISNCGYVSLKVQNFEKLYELIHEYKEEYLGDFNNGVTTFLYSAILTHGVENIISELDMEANSLIAHHGHASQEAVNLLLTGKATSNCFNGEKDLDGMILKGVTERQEFGFLTLFEHYKYMEVESNLKTPYLPIWVICKEYHYSVMFGRDARVNENFAKQFDIIYYDELYDTEDPLLLTVQIGAPEKQSSTLFGSKNEQNQEDDDLTPTLELVMRTKWGKNIKVNWNESTPIL